MAILNRDFLKSLGNKSTYHDSTFIVWAAEDDISASKLMNEANENVQEMHEHMAIAEEATAAAKKAEKAGETFKAAAAAVEKGQEVSEAAVAKADTQVNEVADKAKKKPEELAPDITKEERATVAGESDSGYFVFKPAYSNLRKKPAAMRRVAESMFSEIGSFFSNVWDNIVKAYHHFCQWVGKYFGTYVRTKSRLEDLIKQVRKSDSIRIEQTKIEIKGSDVSNFTTMKNNSDDEMLYIDDGSKISEQLIVYKKYIDVFIDNSRQNYSELSNIASIIAGGQYSNKSSAEESVKEIEKVLTDINGKESDTLTKALVDKYTDGKSAGIEFKEYGRMTCYKRFVYITADTAATDSKFKEDTPGAIDYSGFKIVEGSPDSKRRVRSELNVNTLTLNQIEDICRDIINILTDLISYQESRSYLKNKFGLEKIKDATEKLKSNVGRDSSSYDNSGSDTEIEAANKKTRELSKIAIAYARKFTRNATTWQSYLTYFDRFIFALESLFTKSIHAHK